MFDVCYFPRTLHGSILVINARWRRHKMNDNFFDGIYMFQWMALIFRFTFKFGLLYLFVCFSLPQKVFARKNHLNNSRVNESEIRCWNDNYPLNTFKLLDANHLRYPLDKNGSKTKVWKSPSDDDVSISDLKCGLLVSLI